MKSIVISSHGLLVIGNGYNYPAGAYVLCLLVWHTWHSRMYCDTSFAAPCHQKLRRILSRVFLFPKCPELSWFYFIIFFDNVLELLTAHFHHRCGTVVHFVHKIQQIYLGRVARIAARLDRRVELQQSPALSHRLQLWSRLKIQNFPDSDNSPIAVKVRLQEYFPYLFNILL